MHSSRVAKGPVVVEGGFMIQLHRSITAQGGAGPETRNHSKITLVSRVFHPHTDGPATSLGRGVGVRNCHGGR